MALCDCGATTARLLTKCTDVTGRPLPEPWKSVCPECSPADFPEGRILNDKKLWLMKDVEPNEYETRDGQAVMKDWAQGELEERISKDPDKEAKRAQARKVKSVYGDHLPQDVAKQINDALGRGITQAAMDNLGLVDG